MLKRVFCDFDGVLVESNSIKHEAFFEICSRLPDRDRIIEYHQKHNHLTRFQKFDHICREILSLKNWREESTRLANDFGKLTFERITKCKTVEGALDFLQSAKWPIDLISATPEKELKEIVQARGWDTFFASVHGGPIDKAQIMSRILKDNRLRASEVIFIGDSAEDFASSQRAQIPFVGRKSEHPLNSPILFNNWFGIKEHLDFVDREAV